ncbi:MAG TPA: iron-sulfur cluster assembly protein [Ktedonobacteraceae bacterium]|nr:iron-sulfur cluster assembly protein [Ktedonobacteraceae bacterium]
MPRDNLASAETGTRTGTTSTREAVITPEQVYAAIADVLDPELDETLVKLGFIDSVRVDGPDVTVVFKLPTFWCAPNFAYLMAADLRSRLRTLPGVRAARVVLLDHFAEEEISSGINRGLSFGEAFPEDACDEDGANLEELRRTFLRKGFLMRQDTLLRKLLQAGLDEATILNLRVVDLVVDELADAAFVTTPGGAVRLDKAGRSSMLYLRKGKLLGLAQGEQERLIIDDEGRPVPPGGLKDFLRRSRSVRMNILFNTSLCKGLFQTRYGPSQSTAASEADEGENV